jgi:hypothetical protein
MAPVEFNISFIYYYCCYCVFSVGCSCYFFFFFFRHPHAGHLHTRSELDRPHSAVSHFTHSTNGGGKHEQNSLKNKTNPSKGKGEKKETQLNVFQYKNSNKKRKMNKFLFRENLKQFLPHINKNNVASKFSIFFCYFFLFFF